MTMRTTKKMTTQTDVGAFYIFVHFWRVLVIATKHEQLL